jgi:hypothetical protein
LQEQWDMSKPDLILYPGEHSSFRANYLYSLFKEFFNYREYNPIEPYNNHSLFVSNILFDRPDKYPIGVKKVIDSLWEKPKLTNSAYILKNKNWFWYNECLSNIHNGYNNYEMSKTYSKLAFMPINKVKDFRSKLVNKLSPYLDDFIYSYDKIKLPNDISADNILWERYFNPEWYNNTYFSLVVETRLIGNDFVTEKTFKPCAFKHPFMVYGQSGTLKFIKKLGFETYENLFDESYDTDSTNKKIEKIITNIKNFNKIPYSKLTLDKINHNHALFFNKELVINKIKKEIIEPLLEYAEL